MCIKNVFKSGLLASLLFIAACKNSSDSNNNPITTDVVNIPSSAADNITDVPSLPKFTFTEEVFNFGKIIQGEKVSHSFRFKNTGGSDLVISEAHGSCGCTVPRYPRRPIPSGAEDVIDVTFDSDGKSGKTEKTIMITANTTPNVTVLKIIVEVEVPEEK